MFKNALVSVSDKTGLVDFIRPLTEKGLRVVSTGGTARLLQEAGISVVNLSEQTGSPEVMGGRVKSLHPNIYMPLLARKEEMEDTKILNQKGLDPFDLVICNLYPFEKKKSEGIKDLVEWIDVGGPSLLRAAAKNFASITVLCSPKDYASVLEQAEPPSLQHRKKFAAKAFLLLADYNISIAQWMGEKSWEEGGDFYLKGRFYNHLRYGENPDQKAAWFQIKDKGLHTASLLQGKELSFNNICDLDSAVGLVREFDKPCCVAIKHNNPCAVACDDDLKKACELSLKGDPISIFGGVIALNRPCSKQVAELLCSLFLEAVIAPNYSVQALKLFESKKKNLRVLKWSDLMSRPEAPKLRCVEGGFLIQDSLKVAGWSSNWKYTEVKPATSIQGDLLMAWQVAAHLKSNAIALVSEGRTVGLGEGQVNRVSALETAIKRWKKHHSEVLHPVMASDGFFPFPDSVELAAEAGIKWIIQPGGSIKDQQIISRAKELSIYMVLTGQRCFSH